MVIYLPSQSVDEEPLLDELTPREIVRELDKHVIGQADAKRAVAIALRNRIRRQKLRARNGRRGDAQEHPHDRPHRRRQDRARAAPGEAGQFAVPEGGGQQVHRSGLRGPRRGIDDPRPGGYRDRHGARGAARRSRRPRRSQRRRAPARSADAAAARSRARAPSARARSCASGCAKASSTSAWWKSTSRSAGRRSKSPPTPGIEEMGINLKDMLPSLFGQQHAQAQDARGRGARLPGAGRGAEAHRHGPGDARRAGARGDRAASSSWTRSTRSPAAKRGHGPDVSREGVQRDILPIVEGTTVNTRYGFVRTDHILFIAAGAFHVSKPSDLIPELQGRFPDPRGAEVAHRGGFHPHPERAEERARRSSTRRCSKPKASS